MGGPATRLKVTPSSSTCETRATWSPPTCGTATWVSNLGLKRSRSTAPVNGMTTRTSWPKAVNALGSAPATSPSPPTLESGAASAARNRIFTPVYRGDALVKRLYHPAQLDLEFLFRARLKMHVKLELHLQGQQIDDAIGRDVGEAGHQRQGRPGQVIAHGWVTLVVQIVGKRPATLAEGSGIVGA